MCSKLQFFAIAMVSILSFIPGCKKAISQDDQEQRLIHKKEHLAKEPLISGSTEVIIQEDWEQGLNPEKWHIYGDPLPYLYQGKAVRGNFSFANHGDSNYPSGVVSKDSFPLVPNMTITFWSNLHSEGSTYRNLNQHNDIWLTTSPLSNFGNDQHAELLLPWLRHHAGPQQLENESGYTICYGNPKGLFISEPDFGKWVKFMMTTKPDGSIEYFKDGQLLHKTQAGTITYDPPQTVRMVINGKSFQSLLLVDDISVEIQK